MSEEGYLKFQCERVNGTLGEPTFFRKFNLFRTRLWDLGLVGEKENGIGFGNLSRRIGQYIFITGSQTGGKRELEIEDYVLVLDWNWERFTVKSFGKRPCSSETFTHLAVYTSSLEAKVVVHIHSAEIWQWAKDKIPGTPPEAEFGTLELALAVRRLVARDPKGFGWLVLLGHEEGLIVWGKTVSQVLELIMVLVDLALSRVK